MTEARIHEYGTAGGPAHVLLHGIPGSRITWERVLERAGDHRVLVVELPDHGEGRESESQARAFEGIALDTVRRLADRRLRLCGLSYGAYLAARIAPALEDRVERMVLLGGFPAMWQEGAAVRRELLRQLEEGAIGPRELAAAAQAILLGEDGAKDPVAVDALEREMADVDVARWRRYLGRAIELTDPDLQVPPYEAPAMLLHGTREQGVPIEQGRALAALGTRARLVEIDTDSHMLPLTHPDQVARLLFERG